MNIKKIIFSMIIISLAFTSCRVGESDFGFEEGKTEPLKVSSAVADLIKNVTKNDGSNDNIIDKANCFNIKFPYTVKIKGVVLFINSEEDLENTKTYLNYTNENTIDIIFPVTLIFTDFSEVVVNSQGKFNQYRNQCNDENIADDDIECIDFKYPLTLSIYNTSTERTTYKTMNNDREMNSFVNNLNTDDVVYLDFPVNVVVYDGTETIINNLEELETTINRFKEDCDEDDDYDFNDDDVEVDSPCTDSSNISLPFSYDGTGEFCWVTSDDMVYVNSWDLEYLTINGTDLTNRWSDESISNFPDKIDGEYHIHYRSNISSGHFETGIELPDNSVTINPLCDTPTDISVPYSFDGTGEYCWVTTDDVLYFNSWELDLLEINGVDFTNEWTDDSYSNFPDKIDGKYYIHFISSVDWGHFEAGTELPDNNNNDDDNQCSDCSVQEAINALTGCSDYKVDKFKFYSYDLKKKYEDYTFTFESNGTIIIKKDTYTFNGSWSVSEIYSNTYVSIYIHNLPELNGSWKLQRIDNDDNDNDVKIYLDFGFNELRLRSSCN